MSTAFSTFSFQNNKMWTVLQATLPPPTMISARAQALWHSPLLYPCLGSHQAELLLCHHVTSKLWSQVSGVLSLSLASGTTWSLSPPGSCVGTLTPGPTLSLGSVRRQQHQQDWCARLVRDLGRVLGSCLPFLTSPAHMSPYNGAPSASPPGVR